MGAGIRGGEIMKCKVLKHEDGSNYYVFIDNTIYYYVTNKFMCRDVQRSAYNKASLKGRLLVDILNNNEYFEVNILDAPTTIREFIIKQLEGKVADGNLPA